MAHLLEVLEDNVSRELRAQLRSLQEEGTAKGLCFAVVNVLDYLVAISALPSEIEAADDGPRVSEAIELLKEKSKV